MTLSRNQIQTFRDQIAAEWRNNIAPFWIKHVPDEKYGGFHGWITNDLHVDEHAEKGIILNTRILWTFARAYRIDQDPNFRRLAERAFQYLTNHFIDRECGGVFWTLDYQGQPLDTKKRSYAQAFAIYALAEFYISTGENKALQEALAIFNLLESSARDNEHEGYFETFERDWSLATDQRLSEVDQDEKKSMNTHLHLLEAYATLAGARNNGLVKDRLRTLVKIFLTRIIQPNPHRLQMFFDESWHGRSDRISFGHDIETSWLLCEAAQVLGDPVLLADVNSVCLQIAQSVYEHGLDDDGSLLYEADSKGIVDDDKHWWAQTEAIVGLVNAYELSGDEKLLLAAIRVWEFVRTHIVDKRNGEWFWKTSRNGVPDLAMPKVSQWKCPYHNARMCFEIERRLSPV